jgi:hypothetical protein
MCAIVDMSLLRSFCKQPYQRRLKILRQECREHRVWSESKQLIWYNLFNCFDAVEVPTSVKNSDCPCFEIPFETLIATSWPSANIRSKQDQSHLHQSSYWSSCLQSVTLVDWSSECDFGNCAACRFSSLQRRQGVNIDGCECIMPHKESKTPLFGSTMSLRKSQTNRRRYCLKSYLIPRTVCI